MRRRVIDVCCMVYPAALDHQEKALVAVLGGLREGFQCSLCHLAQAWIDVGHVLAVNFKGHIGAGKKTQNRQGRILAALETVKACAVIIIGPPVLLLGNPRNIYVVQPTAAVRRVWEEVAPSSAKYQVNDPPECALANLLESDFVLLLPDVDVAGEASWCRVLYFC